MPSGHERPGDEEYPPFDVEGLEGARPDAQPEGVSGGAGSYGGGSSGDASDDDFFGPEEGSLDAVREQVQEARDRLEDATRKLDEIEERTGQDRPADDR